MSFLSKKTFYQVLAIVVLTFVAYSFMLQNNFKTQDDAVSIIRNENIHDFRNIGKIWGSSFFGKGYYYRPLVSASYMIEYHLFGLNAFYYYLTNIFLHIATALAVFGLMRQILKDGLTSFAAALLFAIHPIHWEAVSNISGRAILLNAFFLVNAFLVFIFAQKRKPLFFLSLFLFFLALMSKESAGIFPLVLLCYQFMFNTRQRDTYRFRILPVLPFIFAGCIYILIRRYAGVTGLLLWPDIRQAALGFMTFLKGVMIYLRLVVFPVDLYFDRSQKIFASFFGAEAYAFFFLACIIVLFKFRKKIPREAKFFLAWFWIELIPVCQFPFAVGAQLGYISTAEHFLYMPSMALFAIGAIFVRSLYERNNKTPLISKRIFAAIILGIYAFYFLSAVQHNIYASSEMAMFERTLKFNPDNVRIRNSLAGLYAKSGKFKAAQGHYERALEMVPADVQARIGLAKALCDQGDYWAGVAEYEKIREPGVYAGLLKENLRLTYQALAEQYQLGIRADPQNPLHYFHLGLVYEKIHEVKEAIPYFAKAAELKPDFKEAFFHLGLAFENLEQFNNALEAYARIIALMDYSSQVDAKTCFRAVWIFERLGRPQEYREYIKRAQDFLDR